MSTLRTVLAAIFAAALLLIPSAAWASGTPDASDIAVARGGGRNHPVLAGRRQRQPLLRHFRPQ